MSDGPKNEIRKTFVIGEFLYRSWRHPGRDDYWYEPCAVVQITPKYVYVWHPHGNIRFTRRRLERYGVDHNASRVAVCYVELPEEYRKQTVGYLLEEKPRAILGLSASFTPEMLKEAYRRKARETHPDNGGTQEAFMEVEAAYRRLSDPDAMRQIGEILREKAEQRKA